MEQNELYQRLEKVVKLLQEEKVTAYRISEDTQRIAPTTTLISLREGRAEVKNLYFQTAQVLLDWYNEHYKEYS